MSTAGIVFPQTHGEEQSLNRLKGKSVFLGSEAEGLGARS